MEVGWGTLSSWGSLWSCLDEKFVLFDSSTLPCIRSKLPRELRARKNLVCRGLDQPCSG